MRTTKLVLPVLVLLAACDADIISPAGTLSYESPMAARATTALTLNTSPRSDSEIWVSWNDDARDETGWEVHRSTGGAAGAFTLRATLATNSTGHTDDGLTSLTQYCYKVRSFKRQSRNTSYGKFSNVSCATTLGAPLAPSSTSAAPRTSSIVEVRWTDNSGSEHGFRIERSPEPDGAWAVAGTVGVNITTFSDAGRLAEEAVCYRVIATNPYGESAPSEVDCTAPPNRPSLIATSANGAIINVTWTDASTVEDGYEVQRARDDLVWTAIADLPANATSYGDASASPDVRMWYRIRAKKDGGFSDFSDKAWGVVASRAPDAPSLTYVSPGNSTTAALQWDNVSATATGIRIERSVDGQVSWTTVTSIPVTQDMRFWDMGRVPESLVCYRGFAFNSYGESGSSGVDCTVPPAGPTNLSTYGCGDFCSVFQWTDNSNVEERYELFYTSCYSESECYWGVRYLEANSTVAVLADGDYYSGLYAFSDGGYSDEATWATNAAMPAAGTLATRPTSGARAPRPSVAAGQLRLKPGRP